MPPVNGTITKLRLEIPCTMQAPAEVRQALRALEGIGWILGDAMLVASELVTHVVLHCSTGEEAQIEVMIERHSDHLLIEIRTAAAPAVGDEEDPYESVGIQLVQALCRRFETGSSGGYEVRAELALPPE